MANQSGCLFTRAAAGGLAAIVATLAERRALTLEHSRMWLGHVGLVTPLESVEGDAELVAATRATLDEGVHQLADTIRNSLNFYRMQDNAENGRDARCSRAPRRRSPASPTSSPSSSTCRSRSPSWPPTSRSRATSIPGA